MAENFLLEIVTPLRKVLSREVEEVTAPGQEGEFGVLTGHTPFLTSIRAGEISFKKGSEAGFIAVGRGYAEVLPDKTTILVDSAEFANEIDFEAARTALSRAENDLKNMVTDDPKYQATLDAYELASAKLRIKEKMRG